jgi:hypothetical protein
MSVAARLELVHKAICAGYRGQIEWKDSCLKRFRGDPEIKGFTEKGVKELLWDFVRNQKCQLRQHQETDPEWLDENPDDPWWYYAVIPTDIFPKGLFVKVKLIEDDDEDPWVQIISVHEEREGRIL